MSRPAELVTHTAKVVDRVGLVTFLAGCAYLATPVLASATTHLAESTACMAMRPCEVKQSWLPSDQNLHNRLVVAAELAAAGFAVASVARPLDRRLRAHDLSKNLTTLLLDQPRE